jgi:hypothetical protein
MPTNLLQNFYSFDCLLLCFCHHDLFSFWLHTVVHLLVVVFAALHYQLLKLFWVLSDHLNLLNGLRCKVMVNSEPIAPRLAELPEDCSLKDP